MEEIKHLILLRMTALFSGVGDIDLEKIANVTRRRQALRGTALMRSGERSDAVYIIISGAVRVVNHDESGREVILSQLHPGECFGEMGAIDNDVRSATIVASENCELFVIASHDFRHCLETMPQLSSNVMRRIVQRLREADRKIESLALTDVSGRVSSLLFELSELNKEGQRIIRKRITRKDISKMVGASREAVSRAMKDLVMNGRVRTENGILILEERRTSTDRRATPRSAS
ncbi:MAG: cyclic nucleotide-binding domain-containing protein [Betaproteobacteria bacterium]|nr:cyclic nucleotide-binding domain-containing protein [Betaproteobacteria bacterium]